MIVILNSGGGSFDREQQSAIVKAFGAHHINAHVRVAQSGAQLRAFAEEAASGPDSTVVAGGGDGTISAVASSLVGTGKQLGVLPLGTLNHFAKDLKIPVALDKAIRVIAEGHTDTVDVGEVNGHSFLNNSSLGLYPRIVRDRETQQNQLGRGKWPAFAWAMLAALHVFPMLKLRVYADGRELRGRTPFLFIGNNEYRMDLLKIGARDRLDQGTLEVYFPRVTGRSGLFLLALRSFIGRVKQAENFETLRVAELRIEVAHERSLHVATDGEVSSMTPPLLYRIRPRALRVIVPKTDDQNNGR